MIRGSKPRAGACGDRARVISDGKVKQFKCREEVPASVLKSRFDYLDADTTDGFFCYRGQWMHTAEFMRVDGGDLTANGWHGVASDSAWTGTVIALDPDGEGYTVGSYIAT